MAKSDILHHIGDVGTAFRITILDYDESVIPVSTAITIKFSFLKPDKTIVSKIGSLYTDGLDGKVQYITIVGDLDIKGLWKLQVWVYLADGKWYTSKSNFQVDDNIVNY